MPVQLYMDIHVPQAITDQLRRRGVNVLTAIEDEYDARGDDDVLLRATELNRVLFSQDIRFGALAQAWQRNGKQFSGFLFGHQSGGTIGDFVADLELIAVASELSEWPNVVQHLPFPRK